MMPPNLLEEDEELLLEQVHKRKKKDLLSKNKLTPQELDEALNA